MIAGNASLLQVWTLDEDKEKVSEILEKLGTNLSIGVNILIKQINNRRVSVWGKYEPLHLLEEEVVNAVRAKIAFEDMDLVEKDVQLLYAYKNDEVSEDELRWNILEGIK